MLTQWLISAVSMAGAATEVAGADPQLLSWDGPLIANQRAGTDHTHSEVELGPVIEVKLARYRRAMVLHPWSQVTWRMFRMTSKYN